jgi:hypothetical protein
MFSRFTKNMGNNYRVRMKECYKGRNVAEFDDCAAPFFKMHTAMKKDFALGSSYIFRKYAECLDNSFEVGYCLNNAESRFKSLSDSLLKNLPRAYLRRFDEKYLWEQHGILNIRHHPKPKPKNSDK